MLMHVFLLRTPGWISYKCSWKTTLFLGICCRLVCFFPADSSTTSNPWPKPTIKSVTSVAESFDSAKKRNNTKSKLKTPKKTETDRSFLQNLLNDQRIDRPQLLCPKSHHKKKKQQPTIFGEEIPGDFRGFILPTPKKNRSEALSRKSVERARKIPPNSSSICFGDLLFGKWVDYK